ncbi:MAG: MFS transporter, partial [Hydrogenobacter sp.]
MCSIPRFEGNILDTTKLILSRYRLSFLFSSSMSRTILATYYGMITFIPVSFPLNSEDIPRVLLVGRVGGLIGGILVTLASDFFGRKITDTFVSFMSFLLSLLFLLSFNFDLT